MSVTVPEGLTELLQEFTVTVLRLKPNNLVEFAATYFNNLKIASRKDEACTSEQASTAEMEIIIEGEKAKKLLQLLKLK